MLHLENFVDQGPLDGALGTLCFGLPVTVPQVLRPDLFYLLDYVGSAIGEKIKITPETD